VSSAAVALQQWVKSHKLTNFKAIEVKTKKYETSYIYIVGKYETSLILIIL